MQHGELDLRMAKLDDLSLIRKARKCAEDLIDMNIDISKYQELNNKVKKLRVITNLN